MFHLGMTKLIALLQFLLALAGCSPGGTTWTSRMDAGPLTLHSRASVQDGVAHFECVKSSSGACHYTLYPDACNGSAACQLAPLQRFNVASGDSRQLTGVIGFRPCVRLDDALPMADCRRAGGGTD